MKLPALVLAVTLPATMAFGQSLAELADDAKKKRKKDTPVYTDDDLKQRSSDPAASPASGSEGSSAAQGSEGGGGSSSGDSSLEGGGRGRGANDSADADSWRAERATRLTAIKQVEGRIAATQARLSALQNDLNPTNLMDPFRLQTLEAEKAKARAELEAAELELKQARDELEDFDEDARKKGVPPGWLREP
jgi:DNA repair exonuclease SbcCD ATPase subunit